MSSFLWISKRHRFQRKYYKLEKQVISIYSEVRHWKIIEGGNTHSYPDFLNLSLEFQNCHHSGQQDAGLGTTVWCFWPQPPDWSPFYEMFLCCCCFLIIFSGAILTNMRYIWMFHLEWILEITELLPSSYWGGAETHQGHAGESPSQASGQAQAYLASLPWCLTKEKSSRLC